MPLTVRVLAATLLVAYTACVAAVLGQRDPTLAVGVVTSLEEWLDRAGAPAATTAPGRVEFVLNVAMVVPVTLLAAMVFRRHPWASWVVYGFVASGLAELAQGLLLPPRSAQFADVVANTLGALLGAVMGTMIGRAVGRRGRSPQQGDVSLS